MDLGFKSENVYFFTVFKCTFWHAYIYILYYKCRPSLFCFCHWCFTTIKNVETCTILHVGLVHGEFHCFIIKKHTPFVCIPYRYCLNVNSSKWIIYAWKGGFSRKKNNTILNLFVLSKNRKFIQFILKIPYTNNNKHISSILFNWFVIRLTLSRKSIKMPIN